MMTLFRPRERSLRLLRTCVLPVVLIMATAVPISAATVDQEQPTIDVSGATLSIGSGLNQLIAQVFTVGISGLLSEVRLPVNCAAGTNLIVEIREATSHPVPQPSSIVLTSETFSTGLGRFPAGSATFRRLTFSTPVPVSAGNVLAIVLRATGVCGVFPGPTGDPYLGGHSFYQNSLPPSIWLPWATRDDLPFQTVVDVPKGKDPLRKSVVDQRQPDIDASVGGLSVGGGSEQVLAQVVTAGLAGRLTGIAVPVACSTGSNLILEIQGVVGGQPDGVVATSVTIGGTSLPTFYPASPGFRPLVLGTPVPVVPGQEFAVVLRSSGQCAVFQGPPGDTYLGGDGYFDARPNPPGWVALTGRNDLPFETYVD